MHIEIDVPRPYLTLSLLVAAVASIAWAQSAPQSSAVTGAMSEHVIQDQTAELTNQPPVEFSHGAYMAQGGDPLSQPEQIREAEGQLRGARIEQEIMQQKEEWLRYQLKMLEEERRALGTTVDETIEEEFRESTRRLLALLQDEQQTEAFILESLNQLREAQGEAAYYGRGLHGNLDAPVRLVFWPVEPDLGISAFFRDEAYEKHFGFPHDGVDIPALQGTTIVAVADGIVRDVSDQNGFGFNSITIDHENGAVTLYGHITQSLVHEGERVMAGQPIALSGGRPGSIGAGTSTGPHIHLELFIDGTHVDPIDYLPRRIVEEFGS